MHSFEKNYIKEHFHALHKKKSIIFTEKKLYFLQKNIFLKKNFFAVKKLDFFHFCGKIKIYILKTVLMKNDRYFL